MRSSSFFSPVYELPPGGGSRHPQAAGITLVGYDAGRFMNLLQRLKPLSLGYAFAALETATYNDGVK
jgi:hypothetical protein